MKKKLGLIALGVVVVVLVLALGAAGFGVYTVRRPYPQIAGELVAPGLERPVEIYRDADGIPHIYAETVNDLFFAQGYVHAQDRFYQMDFWRHQTAGRLSELYGESTLEVDRFLRTLGWQRIAEQEYAQSDEDSRAILDAYAAGVNAYIGGRPAAELSLEYSILALNGLSGYQPEPWHPASSLAWGKAMAWDLGGNLDSELMRTALLRQLGPEKTSEFMPLAYPENHPTIVPDPALGAAGLEAPLSGLRARLNAVDQALGGRFEGIGSNNWVIAGSRTTTGKPLLANDPHLGIRMPAIWYEVGLHCQPVSAECPYDVTGFSFAGVPAVVIGHNARIAWGFTNAGPDVQDLFIERLNPDNPNQYEVDGEWVDMEVRTETLRAKGGAEETLTIRATRHGPIITEVYGLEDYAAQAGLNPEHRYALALRWTALEPGSVFKAVFGMNRAANFDEFRAALRDFPAPAQNIVYADVDGNIGYQLPGLIPIRANGDGTLPVPGWNSDYEWTGYVPFEELPSAYNPPQGYIATANNAIVGAEYPYLISLEWDAGYRARRIVDLIEAQPQISLASMQQMQADNLNLGAAEVLPYLLALSFDDPALSAAAEQLRGWDQQMRADSQPAAVYMGFFDALVAGAFHDDVPEEYWPSGGDTTWQVLRGLLAQPDSDWWDDKTTPAVENRDDMLRRALAEGHADLTRRLGRDPQQWTWGALHTATFENETVGRSGIAAIEALFNRGPFPTGGGASIVNATGMDLARDEKDPAANPFAVRSLPSMRMIVDLGNLEASLSIHTTGQSGHAFHPHYVDMADPWRQYEYHPMRWSRAQVEDGPEGVLRLVP